MRVALATLSLALAACGPGLQQDQRRLFVGTAELPIVAGAGIHDCPHALPLDADPAIERVCLLLGQGSEPDEVRDFYRHHMVYVSGWTRARSDERISDVWIQPGTPTTRCLVVQMYKTVEGDAFAEFLMVTLSLQDSRVDACDMSIG